MTSETDSSEKDIVANSEIGNAIENAKKSIEKLEDNTPMDTDEVDEDTVCGLGSFRPKWLQKFATARCYFLFFCVVGIIQGSYFAYLIGCMSTMEKRFAFKSKISGVILMIDEISPLLFGMLVGYFGGKSHRPRMLALGMFLSVLCCFFSAMPFFIYGKAQHLMVSNSSGTDVCVLEPKAGSCDEDDRPQTLAALTLLIIGNFLKGFGSLAFYTVGLSYMDDNTKRRNTPIFFGLMLAFRMLGPVIGFLMSSAFLKIYENPFVDPGFDQKDPKWIGAWWIGFVLQGTLLLIFTFPIMFFPRRLPSMSKPPSIESHLYREIRGVFTGLKRLFSNKLFVFIITGDTLFEVSRFGHHMILPKYMENQFRLSASDSSLYSGPPGLVATQISFIVGGLVLMRYRLNPRTIVKGKTFAQIFCAIMLLLLMIPTCSEMNFVGTSSFGKEFDLQNECNKNCSCTTSVFTPLCGPDGVSTYFSSCHAGCAARSHEDESGNEVFLNCSCVHDENDEWINVEKMEKGFCQEEGCWTQAVIYIIMMPIIDTGTSFFFVGSFIVFLRSIERNDKSFALGTWEACLSLFASIPYPLLFGALTDSACLIWEYSCGKAGNCWVYDIQKLNYFLHGVAAAFCFLSIICNIRVYFLCGNLGDIYKDDEYSDDKKNKLELSADVTDSDTKKPNASILNSTSM